MDANNEPGDVDLTDAATAGVAVALVTMGILAPAAFIVWVGSKLTRPS